MLGRRKGALVGLGVLFCLATYATWPEGLNLNIDSCSPKGLFANASRALYGDTFWRAQLDELQRRRGNFSRIIASMNSMQAQAESDMADYRRKEKARDDELHARYPALAPSNAQRIASALRARAEDIEIADTHNKMRQMVQERAKIFAECEQLVATHVR